MLWDVSPTWLRMVSGGPCGLASRYRPSSFPPRRQQDEDRKVRRPGAPHPPRTLQGHARTTQRNRRPSQHDTFWFVGSLTISVTGLNTFTDENRQQLVNAGAIPVLVSLLSSQDTDVQYYCTTALSNIAVDGMVIHRHRQSLLLIFDMKLRTGRSLLRRSLNSYPVLFS